MWLVLDIPPLEDIPVDTKPTKQVSTNTGCEMP